MASLLWKRQSLDDNNDNSDYGYYDGYGSWWWTPVSLPTRTYTHREAPTNTILYRPAWQSATP